MKPAIILFTGLPGTGKTTLSRQVSETLHVPLVAKDDIKEIMYDNIGWSDKEFSAKLGRSAFRIMEYVTEQHLKSRVPIMLEGNFFPRIANELFQTWQQRYGCAIVQVVCRTDIPVLAQRYFERQEADRHPGHIDTGTVAFYEESFKRRSEGGEDQPLDVDGPVLVVDTTDFRTVSAQNVAGWVRSRIR